MNSARYIGPYYCPKCGGMSKGPCQRCNAVTLHLGEVAMSDEWKPIRVQRLDNENRALQKRHDELHHEPTTRPSRPNTIMGRGSG